MLKKKFVFVVLSLTIVLSGCGPAPQTSNNVPVQNVNNAVDDDTVLFYNKDGSDCDMDDLIEGDSDCYGGSDKKKKSSAVKSTSTSSPKAITTSKPVATTAPKATAPSTSKKTGSFSSKSSSKPSTK
ncbi:MAG: hypothetical protein K0R18_261 [Bacillales bacterium]|jgi:hypothetical protein|nr:hypothetical protein [Bacillales bacterium]